MVLGPKVLPLVALGKVMSRVTQRTNSINLASASTYRELMVSKVLSKIVAAQKGSSGRTDVPTVAPYGSNPNLGGA